MRFWLLNLVLLFDIFGKKCLIDSDYCPIKMGRLLLLNSHVCILFCDSFLPHVNSKTQFCSLQYHLLMRIAFLRFNGRKSVFNSIQTNAISQEIKLRFSKEKKCIYLNREGNTNSFLIYLSAASFKKKIL